MKRKKSQGRLVYLNNQIDKKIKIFINLEIVKVEDKIKKYIYIYIYIYFLKNLKFFLQLGEATWRNYGF